VDGLPDSTTIKTLKKCVGSSNLYIKGAALCRYKPCTKIDVNGIAQGYSVDVIADYLEAHGIKDYLVELGGEIRVKGHKQPGGEKMKIGIEAPGKTTFSYP
jgi:thiamine biosynthesis lipoprotein